MMDTLVANLSSVLSEGRCIIFIVYEDKMQELFQIVTLFIETFPLEDTYNFDDYGDKALRIFLDRKLKTKWFSFRMER